MRVLFTSQPLTGHVASLVPLIRSLSDRGHAVAVATGRQFAATAEAAGAHFINVGLPSIEALLDGEELFRKALNGTVMNDVFIGGWSRRMVGPLSEAATTWRADTMISEDTEFAGMMVAEQLGIPHVQVHLGAIPSVELILAHHRDALAVLRRSAGLAPDPEPALRGDRLRFVLAFPNWQPDGLPPKDAVLASAIHGQPPGEKEHDRPRIYASLGTIFGRVPGLAETVARGLDDPAWDVTFAAGGADEVAHVVHSAARHINVVGYADQRTAIRDADIVVCHAGFNTVADAVEAARPMVVLPIAADQLIHAAGAIRNGIATTATRAVRTGPFDVFRIDPDLLSDADVHDAVEELLTNPTYRHSLHDFRARTLALAGVAILDEMLTSGS